MIGLDKTLIRARTDLEEMRDKLRKDRTRLVALNEAICAASNRINNLSEDILTLERLISLEKT